MADYGVSIVAHVLAWDTNANTYKTGDATNIVLKWQKDGVSATTTNACAEVDAANEPGNYKVTLTAAECQCALGKLSGKSSTANIIVIGYEYEFIKFGAPAGASISADIAAAKTVVDAIKVVTDKFVFTVANKVDSNVLLIEGVDATDQIRDAILSDATRFAGASMAAIKTVTDKFVFTVANKVDSNALLVEGVDATDQIRDAILSDATRFAGASMAAIKAKTDQLTFTNALKVDSSALVLGADSVDATALAATAVNEIVAAVFARAFSAAYGALTFDQMIKVMSAVLAGVASGMAGNTGTFRNLIDTADVVVATQDASGNRSVVTLTP